MPSGLSREPTAGLLLLGGGQEASLPGQQRTTTYHPCHLAFLPKLRAPQVAWEARGKGKEAPAETNSSGTKTHYFPVGGET